MTSKVKEKTCDVVYLSAAGQMAAIYLLTDSVAFEHSSSLDQKSPQIPFTEDFLRKTAGHCHLQSCTDYQGQRHSIKKAKDN